MLIWLRSYRRDNFLPDLAAGLSLAGLLIPEAVAYSAIANLPPIHGLVGAGIGLSLYAFVGTSRYAAVAPTSSAAAIVAGVLGSLAHSRADSATIAAGLVLLTGLYLIVAGRAQLGFLADLISRPVLRGFTLGLAITIVIKQLPKAVGLSSEHSTLFGILVDCITHIGMWNTASLVLALTAISLLMLVRYLQWHRFPAAFVVVVLGIAFASNYDMHRFGVTLVGNVSLSGLRFGLPNISTATWLRLTEIAFALLIVLFAESMGSIRNFALKHGDDVDANREMFALGLANLGSGLLQGLPVAAGFSATSANDAGGARSQMSAWISAIGLVLIIFSARRWVALVPEPILAAVVIFAVSESLRVRPILALRAYRADFLSAAAATLAVISLGILNGLLAAVGFSLLQSLRRFSELKVSTLGQADDSQDFLDISKHPDTREIPGILILRPDSPLFFANIEGMCGLIRGQAVSRKVGIVVLSLEESPSADFTTVQKLQELDVDLCRQGIDLILARVKDEIRDAIKMLPKHPLSNPARQYWSVWDAVYRQAPTA